MDRPRLSDYLAHAFLLWVRDGLQALAPPRPRPPFASILREENDMLIYGLALPPKTDTDVVSYELTEVVNGGDPRVAVVDETTELSYNDGDEVSLSVVEIDADGRRSDPSDPFTFTATDTLPPPKPGQVGVNLLREE